MGGGDEFDKNLQKDSGNQILLVILFAFTVLLRREVDC
jgi:hypothetical protein